MKAFIFFASLLTASQLCSQQPVFPQGWEGDWKGELYWYTTGHSAPQKVIMELRVHPSGTDGTWDWQIRYGTAAGDSRPYKLIRKDSSGVHWIIDEQNGIILDQYLLAGKLCGAFTVQSSTIINSYTLEQDQLQVEFYTVSAGPVATTGEGTKDTPQVMSYRIKGYQKALLKRVQ